MNNWIAFLVYWGSVNSLVQARPMKSVEVVWVEKTIISLYTKKNPLLPAMIIRQ
jgi:hypothetical protein